MEEEEEAAVGGDDSLKSSKAAVTATITIRVTAAPMHTVGHLHHQEGQEMLLVADQGLGSKGEEEEGVGLVRLLLSLPRTIYRAARHQQAGAFLRLV